jgi:histone H3/H4
MPDGEVTKIQRGTLRRIAKELIPDLRLSSKALLRLQDVVTEFARMTITDAKKLAEHRGRKTISEKDLLLASE